MHFHVQKKPGIFYILPLHNVHGAHTKYRKNRSVFRNFFIYEHEMHFHYYYYFDVEPAYLIARSIHVWKNVNVGNLNEWKFIEVTLTSKVGPNLITPKKCLDYSSTPTFLSHQPKIHSISTL